MRNCLNIERRGPLLKRTRSSNRQLHSLSSISQPIKTSLKARGNPCISQIRILLALNFNKSSRKKSKQLLILMFSSLDLISLVKRTG